MSFEPDKQAIQDWLSNDDGIHETIWTSIELYLNQTGLKGKEYDDAYNAISDKFSFFVIVTED